MTKVGYMTKVGHVKQGGHVTKMVMGHMMGHVTRM